jgi:hypothetical protein
MKAKVPVEAIKSFIAHLEQAKAILEQYPQLDAIISHQNRVMALAEMILVCQKIERREKP